MKKYLLKSLFGASIVVLFSAFTVLFTSGIAGWTGSPGEETCIYCHDGNSLNESGGQINVVSNPAFTNGTYIPGQLYNMTVTVSKPGYTTFGFGIEFLNSIDSVTGLLSITDSITTQMKVDDTYGRMNMLHAMYGGEAPNTFAFNFNWKAPDTGKVTIYAAGVAGNLNHDRTGDYVYTTKLALTPQKNIGIESNLQNNKSNISVFPSPTKENINVTFSLQNPEIVSLGIYAISGELVTELYKGLQNKGEHNLSFHLPDDLPKGIYFIKLNIKGTELLQKLIVL